MSALSDLNDAVIACGQKVDALTANLATFVNPDDSAALEAAAAQVQTVNGKLDAAITLTAPAPIAAPATEKPATDAATATPPAQDAPPAA